MNAKTILAECAAYHRHQAIAAEGMRLAADKLNIGTQILDAEIAMHKKFALACAEADGDERNEISKTIERMTL